MNKIIRICNIVVFIIFTQIAPFIHWHAHEHHGEVDLHLSLHPPEFPIENNTHHDHHDQVSEHEHEETHFVGDWNFIHHVKTINVFISELPLVITDFTINDSQVLCRKPLDIPPKLLQQYLTSIISNRAPPQFS